MNKDTELKILKLELKQQEIVEKNLSKKIQRYEHANKLVRNTIAQQDIDDSKNRSKNCPTSKRNFVIKNRIYKELFTGDS